jgi:hypothetical protein
MTPRELSVIIAQLLLEHTLIEVGEPSGDGSFPVDCGDAHLTVTVRG